MFVGSTSFANESLQFQAESFLREGKAMEALSYVDQNKLSPKADLLIRARAHYILKDFSKSEVQFSKLMKVEKKPDSAILMRLAQLKLKLEKPKSALALLKRVKKFSIKKELLVSQALWDSGNKEGAYSHLANLPKKKILDRDLIERQKIFYLFSMGRVKQLFDISKEYLNSRGASAEFGIYGVSLLKEKNRYLAEVYFDLLIAAMPSNDLVLKERGVFELEAGNSYVASLFLDRGLFI